MTRSAMRIVLIAEIRLSLASTSSPPSSGTSSLTPIQSSSAAPISFSHGSVSSATAKIVRMIRITTAAPAPQKMACFCCLAGSARAASAITTALSPERTTLTPMIFASPIQKACVISSCIELLLARCDGGSRDSNAPQRAARGHRAAARSGLEQAHDLAVDEVDLLRGRHLRQPGHRHDVAADHHDELRSGREPHLADVHHVTLRRGAQLRVGRERVLRLGDAHRIMPVAVVLELLDLRAHLRVGGDLARAVDRLRDFVDLVPKRVMVVVHEPDVRLLLAKTNDDARELRCTLSPVRPVAREHDRHAELRHPRLEELELRRGVLVEAVNRHDARDAVVSRDVLDMP